MRRSKGPARSKWRRAIHATCRRFRPPRTSGTHMDAPRHYLAEGAGIETMPIAASMGRARVIEIADPEVIRTSELEPHCLEKGERILFKTRNSGQCWKTDHFQKEICLHRAPGRPLPCRARHTNRGRRFIFPSVDSRAEVRKPTVSCSKQAFGSSRGSIWSTWNRANMNCSACR